MPLIQSLPHRLKDSKSFFFLGWQEWEVMRNPSVAFKKATVCGLNEKLSLFYMACGYSPLNKRKLRYTVLTHITSAHFQNLMNALKSTVSISSNRCQE